MNYLRAGRDELHQSRPYEDKRTGDEQLHPFRPHIDERTHGKLAWILLATLMLSYFLWISYESVLRYAIFQATAFDLGNMDQVLWNTLHGRLFQFTNQAIDWYGPPTRLAVHFEPILLPLSLLYAFHADPRILLVFQTLVLALGALPVFLLTRKFIPPWPLLAPVLAAAYLLMPALLGLNLFDFHSDSLATMFLLYAFLAFSYQRYGWFLVACFLAATCKEDVPFCIATLGLLLIWRYKMPRLGVTLFLGGMAWGLIAFLVIIPHFYPGAGTNNFWYRYIALGLGDTPRAIILNVLLHPWLLITTFFTLNRLYYLASLFRSTGFFALLAPEWLLPGLPILAVNLLSGDNLLYSGVYQYNAALIPWVMVAAIFGIRRAILLWQRWRGEPTPEAAFARPWLIGDSAPAGTLQLLHLPGEQRLIQALTIIQTGVQGLLATPLVARSSSALQSGVASVRQASSTQWQRFSSRMEPLAQQAALPRLQWFVAGWIIAMLLLNFILMLPLLNIFWPGHTLWQPQLPGSREQHIEQLLARIPLDASVSASDNLNPHLTERRYVTVFPQITIATGKNGNTTVQYVIVDLNAFFPEERVSATNMLNGLVSSGQFRILARAEGVVLLQRRT
jgi:uncharacterized membrane protein